MEVAGLCQACQRPGVMVTCTLCGANVHAQCLQSGLHMHGRSGGGRAPPRDAGGPRT